LNIKETMDLLDVLKCVAECYAEARSDGSVSWFDLPKFRPVLFAMGQALDGLEKVEGEVRDLDMSELLAIAAKLQEIAKAVQGGAL
jgi:hypothetical protein